MNLLENIKNTKFFKIKVNSSLFAVKKVVYKDSIPLGEFRELKFLRKLQHENIVQLVDVKFDKMESSFAMYFVYEFMDFSLADLIKRQIKFNDNEIIHILKQMLNALSFIHGNDVIHRNIHPGCILLQKNGKLKIGDFSNAVQGILTGGRDRLDRKGFKSNYIYSLNYTAPEVLLGDMNYDNRIDSFSVGCILYEIHTCKMLFNGKTEAEQCNLILEAFGSPSTNYPWSSLYNANERKKSEIILDATKRVMNVKVFDIFKELIKVEKTERLSCTNALEFLVFKKEDTVNFNY